jgi:hypothetical protein
MELLLRKFAQKPELAHMVRSASLRTYTPNSNLTINGNLFLQKVSSLRSLKINFGSVSHVSLENHWLNHNPLNHLTTLKFGHGVLIDMFIAYSLPRLRNLTIDLMESSSLYSQFPTKVSPGTLSITKLTFNRRLFHVPSAVLEEVLRWPKELKELSCQPPGVDDPRKGGELLSPFSAATLARVLSPSKSSLTHLELLDSSYHWPSDDMTRLDLHDFVSLKILTVWSRYFFKHGGRLEDRNGLYSLSCPPVSR